MESRLDLRCIKMELLNFLFSIIINVIPAYDTSNAQLRMNFLSERKGH